MAKRYNPSRCDSLRNEAKNLRNKKYRRRVNRDKHQKGSKKYNLFQKDIVKLNEKIDRKRSSIWKCTEEYYNLKQTQQSDRSKIRYRENRMASLDPKSSAYKKYKIEVNDLKKTEQKTREKLFTGSDKYENMGVNYERLVRRIKYLQKKKVENVMKVESGELDQFGNPFTFDRYEAGTEIKLLGEKLLALKEVITNKKIEFIEHDRVDFFEDEETLMDGTEQTIYAYPEVLERALSQTRFTYDKIVISGELIETQSFSYPSQELEFIFELAKADSKYQEFGSVCWVTIQKFNLEKKLTITFNLWEQITDEEKE